MRASTGRNSSEAADTVLAVDDNPDALYALEKMLQHHGYRVTAARTGAEALERAAAEPPSVVLLDVMMPELDGLEVTRRFKADPVLRFVPVILLTAKNTLDDLVEGLEAGADGYITKPFKPEELLARTRAALRLKRIYQDLRSSEETNSRLLEQLSAPYDFANIIGSSPAIHKVFSLSRRVAATDSTVLITGNTGTGKELLARAIHYNSGRARAPFVAKNCAAFSEHLLESQLFGHVRGAFTGAVRDQKGLFEAADGGTLFLDEIGEMPTTLQAKLLRVLQDGTFMPVGTTVDKKVDVRVLAATNRDLRQMCDEKTFREDLYFRLNVINIILPPLAARKDDIPLLVGHFLSQAAEKMNRGRKRLSAGAMDKLTAYSWPGNIRELENEIERIMILSGEEEELDADLLSPRILEAAPEERELSDAGGPAGLKGAVEEVERRLIAETLSRCGGNKTTAAKELGISRSNLIAKVQQYGLEAKKG